MQALPLTGNERFVLSADAILRDESHYQRKGLYFVFLSRANFLQCVDEVAFKLPLFLIHVSLVLTGRCNLFCRHCMAAFYPRPWLPLEQLSDILSNWTEGSVLFEVDGWQARASPAIWGSSGTGNFASFFCRAFDQPAAFERERG